LKAQLALSAGVLALGAAAAAITAALPAEGGYARIGPAFMPALVAAGLLALGTWLLYEALTGGWRNLPAPEATWRRRPFLWVSGGLFAHMALIGSAGFVVAGTVLFVCAARGFGSRRAGRDALLGLALVLAVYLFFTQGLGVSLPAGWTRFPR